MRHTIGIDEAGRGPLAGPVAVRAVSIGGDFDRSFFKGIKDSKQLSEDERKMWFGRAMKAKAEGSLDFAVSLVSESVIDRHGIAYALSLGIRRCLAKLDASPEVTQVFLDGALKAPARFSHQLTVIKGDEKIPVISLASVLAKVTRDERMVRVSKKYPEFKFHIHKGYGTRAHRDTLSKFGPTPIHRRTFLRKILG
jgi:ribonuclease HII